jgi:hypothetical protein
MLNDKSEYELLFFCFTEIELSLVDKKEDLALLIRACG